MKVIAIIGSPRKNGNTEMLSAHALKAITEEGIETEIVSLAGKDIRPCNACTVCYGEEEACSIDDDMFPIYEKMKKAEGIILASPVYFGSMTGLMKSFIERAGYVARRHGEPFRKKVGGPIAVARRGGNLVTMMELTLWFQIMGMVICGSSYWNIAFGREKGEVLKDEEGLKTAWTFGKNVAWALNKLHGAGN